MKRSIRTQSNNILCVINTEHSKVQFNTLCLLIFSPYKTQTGNKENSDLVHIEMDQRNLRGVARGTEGAATTKTRKNGQCNQPVWKGSSSGSHQEDSCSENEVKPLGRLTWKTCVGAAWREVPGRRHETNFPR